MRKFFAPGLRVLLSAVLMLTGLTVLPAPPAEAAVSSWQQSATFESFSPGDFGSPETCREIGKLATTGANYVTFVVMWEQPTATSSSIRPGPTTPSDAALQAGIKCAKARSLKVMLKHHVEAIDPVTRKLITWRANIKPSDRAAWFAAYQSMLVRYGKLAQANGVSDITIGAELTNMTSTALKFNVDGQNTARWRKMIAALRTVFSGKLTFSAQKPGSMGEFDTIGFWPQLDYLGLSGYFSLAVSGTPTLSNLKAKWAQIESTLRPTVNKYGKKLVFTEIGYRSLTGANNDPWNYGRTGAADQAIQALAYEAFFSFWNGIGYAGGVHWWTVEKNPSTSPDSTSYTFQNKRAHNVVAKWYGGSVPTVPLEVWWPTDNAVISGVQPFKARVPNRALSTYRMTWRIGSDAETAMYNSSEGGDHKEAIVDVGPWTAWWQNGVHGVTFTAYDAASGARLGTVTVKPTIQ